MICNLGDLLIFKHEGDMEFEVSIFDLRQCDRICRYLQQETGCNNVEEISKNFEFKGLSFSSRPISHLVTAMKIASKKPQFFKPIQPGFKHGLKIPIGFLKYLEGLNHIKHAILKRTGKKWLVKVNDWRLEEGWEKFAEEHDLQLGDFLIFKHEGYMEFEVSIFDSSHCDREYAEYLQEGGNNAEETFKKVNSKETSVESLNLNTSVN